MGEALHLLIASMTGAALGLVFFGGLGWTLQQGLRSRCPALWFSASLIVRTGITLAGIYLASGLHFERLVACLTGFVIAQLTILFLSGARAQNPGCRKRETRNAPFS